MFTLLLSAPNLGESATFACFRKPKSLRTCRAFLEMNSSWAFPKAESWMCGNHGFVPWTPHISPSAAPGLADPFPRFTEIIFQPFPGCSSCFWLGSSSPSAVPGMGLNCSFTPCLLESAKKKTLLGWVGQEGGKKIQRGQSGNSKKHRIMGISSHPIPLFCLCFESAKSKWFLSWTSAATQPWIVRFWEKGSGLDF